jgi:hypothetical protein
LLAFHNLFPDTRGLATRPIDHGNTRALTRRQRQGM